MLKDPRTSASRSGSDSGQASVEFVALLPILIILSLGLLQAIFLGASAWSASVSARSAARAEAIGTDSLVAAKKGSFFGSAIKVTAEEEQVKVTLKVPSLFPAISAGKVSASAQMVNQR